MSGKTQLIMLIEELHQNTNNGKQTDVGIVRRKYQ